MNSDSQPGRLAYGRHWPIALLLLTTLLAAPTANAQSPATDVASVEIAIDAQPLENALIELSQQTGIGIFVPAELVQGMQAQPLHGALTMEEALQQLLAGTGLSFQRNQSGGYVVTPPAGADSGNAADANAAVGLAQSETTVVDPDLDPGVNLTGEATTASVETVRRGGIEEIIVTGQKKAERIQDVPIAISAFSMEDLDAQKIEGGFDLLKGVPNVTFSKTNFTGYNFQIRGVGTQAISATTDPGVAVSFNNTTLIVNRLFEQEYLDIERVEVLRGPQGTLYGRNATAGVINVISAKPEMGVWGGELKMEIGNYQAQRLRGHVNVPLGDEFALRGAYATTKRDGFGFNEYNGADVDNRDLWTGRLTLGWQPNDRFRANLLWEHFQEEDERTRTSKQLCHHDPGPSQVRSADVTQVLEIYRVTILSQSCVPGSLYDKGVAGLGQDDPAGALHGAYGTPNGAALPFVGGLFWGARAGGIFANGGSGHLGMNPYVDYRLGGSPTGLLIRRADPNPPCAAEAQFTFVTPLNICNPDPYRKRGQSKDLRTISSVLKPIYEAESDVYDFSFDFDVNDHLVLSSQTVYARDELFTTQDFNRFQSFPLFNDSSKTCGWGQVPVMLGTTTLMLPGPDCSSSPTQGRGTYPGANVLPGGVFCDPQLGCSDLLVAQDISQATSKQFNQEFRLVSDFQGDLNFSLGANYTQFQTRNDYFVFANALTLLTNFFPFNWDGSGGQSQCLRSDLNCVFVDPQSLREVAKNPQGHNFFLSGNPYQLKSLGVFGEVYWQATDTLKFTVGGRMTWDRKVFTPVPSQLLLSDYRDFNFIQPGAGPEDCVNTAGQCELAGNALNGMGYPSDPDIVQEWREPTGRFVVDWKPDLSFTDETLLYASLSRGYKGGGANPPQIAAPAGLINTANSGEDISPTFKAEYVNAIEIGTKNTLFGGGLVLNGNVFLYDYKDYQVSKIVNRSAANENFDATLWGVELEAVLAPSLDWQFNAVIGYLNTKIADGEQSMDLMDRTQGGHQVLELHDPIRIVNNSTGEVTEHYVIDEWLVVKPWITNSSNCIVPAVVVEAMLNNIATQNENAELLGFCPGGNVLGTGFGGTNPGSGQARVGNTTIFYDPRTQAPNRARGFYADLSGNELPNAPHFTVALGAQRNFDLPGNWLATARVDYYWQDKSFHRVYNTEYDRLKAWSTTNFSLWIKQPELGLTVEAYVKNAFDETPITGAFLNSDDSGLTTNVFTLDPRLIGLSIRKDF